MSNIAIKVEHLYKEYKLGVISHGTLYRDMQSWWAKARGKEDPNSLISSHHGEQTAKDSFLALNDISFEVKEGDRVGIIGRNGAGKSTLLKILSQITSPTRGNIEIRGRVGSLLEVGTGFHSELTGRENIFLNGSILGMNRHEISRKLDEIVDFAGIEKHLDTPVKRYSSGMTVRLAFAVAAHLDTDILIADEVLAVGDAEFQKKALGKMQDLSTGEGRTILFVSHNLKSVEVLCENGIFLSDGRVKKTDKIKKCIDYYMHHDKEESAVWNNNGKINNVFFTPLEFKIINESGNIIDYPINHDEKIYLFLAFSVQEIEPMLNAYYRLYSDDGTIIYQSEFRDNGTEIASLLRIGINKFKVDIFSNLLVSGKYKIEIICTIRGIKAFLPPDTAWLYFSINGRILLKRENAILSPVIKWEQF